MTKWTLVTGGAKGLGQAICLEMARQGYSVVVHYRTSREEAERTAASCRRLGVQADLIQGDFSSADSSAAFLLSYRKRFASTEVLVHNVGNYLIRSALQTQEAEWRSLFETNFFAPLTLTQGLIESLKENQGAIISIGMAGIGSLRGNTYSSAYTLTKQALWALTQSWAKELAPFQARANMVSPGYLTNSVDLPSSLSSLPMRRLGTLEETARVVSFLADKKNGYLTGQNIEVAGAVFL